MPFIPLYAFSGTYTKQLLTDHHIHAEMAGFPAFALFDFDRAYDQWNGLNGTVSGTDASDGEKRAFAKEVVPTLAPASFEVFRPMLEFIKPKCLAGAEGGEVAP